MTSSLARSCTAADASVFKSLYKPVTGTNGEDLILVPTSGAMTGDLTFPTASKTLNLGQIPLADVSVALHQAADVTDDRQVADANRADRRPDELEHLRVERFDHPAHLTIPAWEHDMASVLASARGSGNASICSLVSSPSIRRHSRSGLPSASALGSSVFGTSW